MKNSIRILFGLLATFPIMLFLNTGFLWETPWKVVQAVIFAIVFTVIISRSNLKKYFFWLGLILVILMMVLYVIGLIEWADIVGSTGVGIVMINIVSYLPQLIRLGYIKNL